MSGAEFIDDEEIAIGLTRNEIRLRARRQFVASLAAAIVSAGGAVSMALVPASHNYTQVAPHKFALVQQATFVTPLEHGVVSAKQSQIELP
jgi:hypothetical protein